MSNKQVIIQVKEDQFEDIIQKNEIVFIDFWAEWCVPCKQFLKVYEKVASLHSAILFASINIEEEPGITELFNIRSIPHLMVLKQGIAIYSESGSVPESTLKELCQQALSADVTAIRAQLDDNDL